MAAYEVELTLTSAKDLKNVNWRNGRTRPYAVVWIDPAKKCSTKVDEEGDTSPSWGETVAVAVPPGQPVEDAALCIDVVHAGSDEGTKPLIGSARLKLAEVLDAGGRVSRSLKLKRPSGRPQGKLEVDVCVREPRYRSRDAYYAPPYGVPPAYGAPPQYGAAPAYGYQYGAAPPPQRQDSYGYQSYGAAPPPQRQDSYGYQSNEYGALPASYGQQPPASYGQQSPASYGQQQPVYAQEEKKKSKFGGMGTGTGLAVGAVAGVLGGLAIAEGVDAVEDHIADKAAEKVADDLGYDDDDF